MMYSFFKEHRLCNLRGPAPTEGPDGTFESIRKNSAESVRGFLHGIHEHIKSELNIEGRSAQNLLNEAEWLRAFESDDIFETRIAPNGKEELVVPPEALSYRGGEFGPMEYLRSLSLEERKAMFVRLMRTLVPDSIREKYRGGHEKISRRLSPHIATLQKFPKHQQDLLLQGINKELGLKYVPPLRVEVDEGGSVISVVPDAAPKQTEGTETDRNKAEVQLKNIVDTSTPKTIVEVLNALGDEEKRLISTLTPFRRREILEPMQRKLGRRIPSHALVQNADGTWKLDPLPDFEKELPLVAKSISTGTLWKIDVDSIDVVVHGITKDEANAWNEAMHKPDNSGAISYTNIQDNVFRDSSFATFPPGVSLDTYLKETKKAGEIDIGNPQSDSFEIMRQVQLFLMGREVENVNHIASQIAKQSVNKRYKGKLEKLHKSNHPMFNDYEDLVREYSLNETQRTEPTAFLQLEGTEPNYLLAGIRLGVIPKATLEKLDASLRKKEAKIANKTEEVNQLIDASTNKLERERVRQETSTIMSNYYNMNGGARILLWAALGYAAYSMLNSKKKIFGVLPVSFIPFIPVGIFYYKKLIKGDADALNTMGVEMKSVVQRGQDLIKKGKEKLNIPSGAPKDKFGTYVDEAKKYLVTHELDVGSSFLMGAMANVKLSTIAANMKNGDVNLERNSTLRYELVRTFDGDDKVVIEVAKDPVQRKKLHDALEDLMMRLGSMLKPVTGDRVQKIMDDYGVRKVPEDLSNIPKEGGMRKQFKQDYEKLVKLGKNRSSKTDGSLSDSLGDFIEAPDVVGPKIDTAERFENPLSSPHKVDERRLYEDVGDFNKYLLEEVTRETLLESDGLIYKHVYESVNNMIQMGMIEDGEARTLVLTALGERIEEHKRKIEPDKKKDIPPKTPLREIVLDIEKFEYALLIACLDAKDLPLNADALIALDVNPGIDGFWDKAISRINNDVITVSSGAHTINNLDNVLSILTERWFTQSVLSLEGRGFKKLEERIDSYKASFAVLKKKGFMNPSYATTYGYTNPAELDSDLYKNNFLPGRGERIETMEKYFAQLLANDILVSMITEHRSDGIHSLDKELEKRVITVKEETNIIEAADAYFEFITGMEFGSDESRSNNREPDYSDGYWEMLDLLDNFGSRPRLPTSNPGIKKNLPKYNPGLNVTMPTKNPGQLQQIATKNPGQLQQLSTQNPGAFTHLAVKNPGEFLQMITDNPGIIRNIAMNNSGTILVLAEKKPSTVQKMAENHPDIAREFVENNPGAVQKMIEQNSGVVSRMVTQNPQLVRQFAQKNPDVFRQFAVANSGAVQKFAQKNPDVARQIVTENPNMIQKMVTQNPSFLQQLVEQHPTAIKQMVSDNPQVFQDFQAQHPDVYKKINDDHPGVLK